MWTVAASVDKRRRKTASEADAKRRALERKDLELESMLGKEKKPRSQDRRRMERELQEAAGGFGSGLLEAAVANVEPSDYEKARLANIERNKAVLASMGLG